MPDNNVIKEISIKKILKEKFPGKKIPGFIIRYLEKIAHQDDNNYFLRNSANSYDIDFFKAALKYLDVTYSADWLYDFPEKKYTFVCNHNLGAIDGLIFGIEVNNRFKNSNVKFMVNELLSNLENMRGVMIPINKIGNRSQTRALPTAIKKLYSSNGQLALFPSGKVARKIKGEITEMPWGKSFIQKSVEYQRDIVPTYFHGKNSNFFYRLANIREKLGIKANIEMLYFANEMYKQKGNHFRIVFGKPIPYQTFDGSKTPQEWADYVKEIVLSMKNK